MFSAALAPFFMEGVFGLVTVYVGFLAWVWAKSVVGGHSGSWSQLVVVGDSSERPEGHGKADNEDGEREAPSVGEFDDEKRREKWDCNSGNGDEH